MKSVPVVPVGRRFYYIGHARTNHGQNNPIQPHCAYFVPNERTKNDIDNRIIEKIVHKKNYYTDKDMFSIVHLLLHTTSYERS